MARLFFVLALHVSKSKNGNARARCCKTIISFFPVFEVHFIFRPDMSANGE
jgi:hypothetical protein